MDHQAIRWAQVTPVLFREYVLSADFKLPTIESPKRNLYKKQPINIHFEIPFFTVSGFQVRYLKIVDRSGYKASPWVKYLTKNGEYQIRMN
jgi:AP-1 complex subunit mu